MAEIDPGTDSARHSDAENRTRADIQTLIDAYVGRLKESGALHDSELERAFRRVPRHLFVERFFLSDDGEKTWTPVEHDPARPRPEALEVIYSEKALVTRLENNLGTSSSSQPGLVAEMLQLLELRPGMRVLEVGTGTGYNAALITELVGDPARVATVDIQGEVVEDARRSLVRAGYPAVRVLCRDGFAGVPEAAPFDRIVATVGCPDVSPAWAEQLAPAGFMLVPLRHAGANPLVRIGRDGRALVGAVVGLSGFMAIRGALSDPAYYASSHGPAAEDASEDERALWRDLGEQRLDFWFYLGLRDPRTRLFRWVSSFGIQDGASGRSARVEEERLVGDSALLAELNMLYEDWRALGAPRMRSFGVEFEPADGATDAGATPQPPAGPWTLPGRYYRRRFALRPEQSA